MGTYQQGRPVVKYMYYATLTIAILYWISGLSVSEQDVAIPEFPRNAQGQLVVGFYIQTQQGFVALATVIHVFNHWSTLQVPIGWYYGTQVDGTVLIDDHGCCNSKQLLPCLLELHKQRLITK